MQNYIRKIVPPQEHRTAIKYSTPVSQGTLQNSVICFLQLDYRYLETARGTTYLSVASMERLVFI